MFVNELNKNVCARREQRPTNLFDRAMPRRRQFSCKRVQSRTCSGYAERSRKCQEKVHGYEHYIHCCVLMLTTTETTFWATCSCHFACEVAYIIRPVVYVVVFIFTRLQNSWFTCLLQRTCQGRLKGNLLPICRPFPPQRRDTAEMPRGIIPSPCSCSACRSSLLWPTPYGGVQR